MKNTRPLSLLTLLASLLVISGCASKYDTQGGSSAPVTTVTTTTVTAPAPVYSGVTAPKAEAPVDNQRLYNTAAITLPQQQHAAETINNFRPVYQKLGSPRLVFYINRDLNGAAKPAVKTTPAPSGKGVVVTANNIADKQTARDIERIAAQPYLQAGATLADQTTLDAQSADTPAPAADVAIETLVTSRQITLPSISGEPTTISIPDIQMTAIRLSDSAILGQATANDIINQLPPAALPGLNVQQALEATALNLMSDITARAK